MGAIWIDLDPLAESDKQATQLGMNWSAGMLDPPSRAGSHPNRRRHWGSPPATTCSINEPSLIIEAHHL